MNERTDVVFIVLNIINISNNNNNMIAATHDNAWSMIVTVKLHVYLYFCMLATVWYEDN